MLYWISIFSSKLSKMDWSETDAIFTSKEEKEKFFRNPIKLRIVGLNSVPVNITKRTIMVLSTISTAAMVTNISPNPAIAPILAKMFSFFSMLDLLNGPELVYPSVVLGLSRVYNKVLPLNIKNHFKELVDRYECTPNEIFVKRELECNLLSNYGEDIIIIYR